ncbi:GCN5 family acetyltransferase [Betaproteobacteria bacterium GR16-43]|nr:GCN5 family acetyltransferase [Betaproteobacteria bacterium GR16-43]
MTRRARYPRAVNAKRVGTFPAAVFAGGGYVWDEVLEYRVWCHPEEGGDDYYYAFATYPKAFAFSKRTREAEEPLALIRQRQYINEPEPGKFVHVKKTRLTEWPVAFLSRPRRTPRTIPDFLSPNAPANRLDILRGTAKAARKRATKK